MGYPSGVISFGTKNAGDTIQPADINTPQTEITAIESGLLNGLQHALTINGAVTVSTGGLTVSTGNVSLGQNLNVAGNSTFAGAVTFSSGVTFASSLTFSGAVTFSSGVTFNQALTVNSALNVGSSLSLSGAFSVPSQSTQVGGASTSANELVIASSAVLLLVNNNSSDFSLGGIAGGTHGRMLYVVNAGAAGNLALVYQNAGTPSTSRFWGSQTLSTSAKMATLIYSTVTVGGVSPGWFVV